MVTFSVSFCASLTDIAVGGRRQWMPMDGKADGKRLEWMEMEANSGGKLDGNGW